MNNTLSLIPGSVVHCRGKDGVILDFIDLETVLIELEQGEKAVPVRISEISSPKININSAEAIRMQRLAQEAIPLISDQRWLEARQRLDALRPLLLQQKFIRDAEEVKAAAVKLNKSTATVYRWLDRYESTKSIQSLMRVQRNDKGKARLNEHQENILSETIAKEYLVRKKSIASVIEAVRERCFKLKIDPPNGSTIQRRIHKLDPEIKTRARLGRQAAKERHELQRGTYPDVGYPLAHTQIDHTPADYCIVDEIHRQPLNGSPTLTVCIDVESRTVLGFTLSLEAPSIRLAGECIIHSVLPKDKFLKEQNVEADWPCYGLFSLVMTDNAPEFISTDFIRACNSWGIDVRKRPKNAPNYAGLIESTFRTFLNKIHETKGGRQPGKGQRSTAYDINGRPIMTLSEFRRYMTIYITKYYHLKPHSGLNGLPPIVAWKRGIVGFGDRKGTGIPRVITDELKLRIDFLRSEKRTVQNYGIKFANQTYTDDILRNWVGSRDPDNPKNAQKFVIKYDPWDISEIYFLDPTSGIYFPIQCNAQLEHITYWENEQIARKQKQENRGVVNESSIFEGLHEMREQEASATKKTRSARRSQQRRMDSQQFSVKNTRMASQQNEKEPTTDELEDEGPLIPLPGARVARLPEKINHE